MTLLYENSLTKNTGGNNKHELTLIQFLLLVLLSETIWKIMMKSLIEHNMKRLKRRTWKVVTGYEW